MFVRAEDAPGPQTSAHKKRNAHEPPSLSINLPRSGSVQQTGERIVVGRVEQKPTKITERGLLSLFPSFPSVGLRELILRQSEDFFSCVSPVHSGRSGQADRRCESGDFGRRFLSDEL